MIRPARRVFPEGAHEGARRVLVLVPLLLGIVRHAHVRLRLRRSPNRATGAILCGGMVVLVISGYLLYYVGSVEAREVSGVAHTVCGLTVPAVLAWHVRQGAKIRLRDRRR